MPQFMFFCCQPLRIKHQRRWLYWFNLVGLLFNDFKQLEYIINFPSTKNYIAANKKWETLMISTSAMLFGIGLPSSWSFSSFICACFAHVNFDNAFSTSATVQLHCFAASFLWLVWMFYRKYKAKGMSYTKKELPIYIILKQSSVMTSYYLIYE